MNLTLDRWNACQDALGEVMDRFGVSGHYGEPPTMVLLHDPSWKWFGYFDWDGTIAINFARCRTWKDVVGTLLHEYRHYLQDPEWMDEAAYEADAACFVDTHLCHFDTTLPETLRS